MAIMLGSGKIFESLLDALWANLHNYNPKIGGDKVKVCKPNFGCIGVDVAGVMGV